MIYMAIQRRRHLFHRLVLGMAVHFLSGSLCYLYGAAAIPSDTVPYQAMGNIGSVTTCNIQGFVLYYSTHAGLLYYGCFSVFSYTAISTSFQHQQYRWIEKYIHSVVHLVPLVAALVLLCDDGYHNSGYGFCAPMDGTPIGCESSFNPDVVCVRSPSLIPQRQVSLLFWIIPLTVDLVFPTMVMLRLYCHVQQQYQQRQQQKGALVPNQKTSAMEKGRRKTNNGNNTTIDIYDLGITPKKIMVQSVIYLVPLYWVVVPFIIYEGLYYTWYNTGSIENPTHDPRWDSLYSFALFTNINSSLFALWTMIAYLFFSVKKVRSTSQLQHHIAPSPQRPGLRLPLPSSDGDDANNKQQQPSLKQEFTTINNNHDGGTTDNTNTTNIGAYIFSCEGEIEIMTTLSSRPHHNTHNNSRDADDVPNEDDGTGAYDDPDGSSVAGITSLGARTAQTVGTNDTPLSSGIAATIFKHKMKKKHEQQQQQCQPQYSFNIFDGTQDASGAFAAYIYDGDSEDLSYDNAETKKWNSIQEHV